MSISWPVDYWAQTTQPCNSVSAGTPVMWKAWRKCCSPLPRSNTQGVLAPGAFWPSYTPVTCRSLYLCVVVTYKVNQEQRVGTRGAKTRAQCRPPPSHTVKDYGRCSSALSYSCYGLHHTSMCCSPDERELRWVEETWLQPNSHHWREMRKCQILNQGKFKITLCKN